MAAEPDKQVDDPGEEAMKLADIAKLKMDHDDYAPLSDAAIRLAITGLLGGNNFGVIHEQMSQEDADEFEADAKDGISSVIAHGVTWVKCFADGSTKRGKIKTGKPVVFDMVSGEGVTGI